MDNQKIDNQPKVRKESKNKIKVDFERTPLKDRLKAKFLNMFFFKKLLWAIVRYVLLIGIAYIVLFPFFSKISASFMAKQDFTDVTVKLIPKHFTIEMYKELWIEQHYVKAFVNSFTLSLTTAIIQTFICSFIAYGFAKFKFKGSKLLFALVLLTLIIPHRTLASAMQTVFTKFDIFGIFGYLKGEEFNIFRVFSFKQLPKDPAWGGIIPDTESFKIFTRSGLNLTNTYWPFIILSLTGLAFKNGLYIFLLRQFFMGVPDELEESAYIDGSGVFRTFFTIILPISIPMMVTVFLFAFSWCWTDDFYTGSTMFFYGKDEDIPYVLSRAFGRGESSIPSSLNDPNFAGNDLYKSAVRNTGGLMIIAPLVVMYLFCQKFLVQGIERSGLTAD